MSDTPLNTSEPTNKPSKYDQLAILIAKDNPEWNNSKIGKEIVRLGGSINPKTIHDKWFKSDYLRREIQEVRDRNTSEIQRRLVPKSIIKLKKQLNNKDDKHQLTAIGLTLKYGMGEMVNTAPQQVNIKNIESIQVAITQDLAAVSGSLKGPD